MITVCHPGDEMEQIFIVSALERAEIPFFIIGQYFGGLYPGIQISAYNERSIAVPTSYVEEAVEVIEDVRSNFVSPSDNLKTTSKFRMLFELILFGWVMPYGNKNKVL